MAFKENFHDWVKIQLESTHNVMLEDHRNYLFYINKVYKNQEEGVKVLFTLSEDFLKKYTVKSGKITLGFWGMFSGLVALSHQTSKYIMWPGVY